MATKKKIVKKIVKEKAKAPAELKPATPAAKASDDEAVCAACGVIFTKEDPKPGSKCAPCSEKK